MGDRPPDATRADPPERYPGTPGWVKVMGLIAIIVVLLIGFIIVTGLGGPHGPQRHGAGAPLSATAVV
jgi:hypothetical protein